MASIIKEIQIDAPPDDVWDALRDFQALHRRLAPGFIIDCRPDGDAARVVTFKTGAVAREVLVGVDEGARRLVYSVVEGPFDFVHHSASAQVVADGSAGTRFVWITDCLPDAFGPAVSDLMEAGLQVMKQTLESVNR